MSRLQQLVSLFLLTFSFLAYAEEITLPFKGITLNADFQTSEAQPLSDGVIVLVHGTLAHNHMEIIRAFQEQLTENGYHTLAINLSLGVDNRHGMYDCNTPHQHKHTDALTEIDQWIQWLKRQGADKITLLGHSRGGNQVAWYTSEHPEQVQRQVLIAPATWSAEQERVDYQTRYKKNLEQVIKEAEQTPENAWLKNTDFIYCADSEVTAGSFLNYYQPDTRFNTPDIIKNTTTPTLVFSGSEDTTVKDLPVQMKRIDNPHIRYFDIEGADHFFMDLYTDEVVELIVEFLESN